MRHIYRIDRQVTKDHLNIANININRNSVHSSMINHKLTEKHNFDWGNVQILDKETSLTRSILEILIEYMPLGIYSSRLLQIAKCIIKC